VCINWKNAAYLKASAIIMNSRKYSPAALGSVFLKIEIITETWPN
jgi:hypothetical protein